MKMKNSMLLVLIIIFKINYEIQFSMSIESKQNRDSIFKPYQLNPTKGNIRNISDLINSEPLSFDSKSISENKEKIKKQGKNKIKSKLMKENKKANIDYRNNKDSNSNAENKLKHYSIKQVNFFNANINSNYYYKVKIKCNIHNCKPEYGRCDETSNFCICNEGYVHAPKINSKKHICRYKQYIWVKCLIYEILLPGLGIFYYRNYYLGLLKIFIMPYVYYNWGKAEKIKLFFFTLIGYILIVNHIVDLVNIIGNNYEDKNGIYPYS